MGRGIYSVPVTSPSKPAYKRVLLKLSGEALMGSQSYGIDPIQFGVMVVLNLIIGTVTPPVGVVLFVVTRIAEISFETMSRAILSWLIPLFVVLALVTLWPPFTTWLPHFMAVAK